MNSKKCKLQHFNYLPSINYKGSFPFSDYCSVDRFPTDGCGLNLILKRFTGCGGLPDPASVESLLAWANQLQDRVEYLVVENAFISLADFAYWHSSEQAVLFRETFEPTVIHTDFRLAELAPPARQYGVRLGQIADRAATVEELRRASLVIRAQGYRRRLFSEFNQAKAVLLP